MTIIMFFGPDGSGKSTLAKNLADFLSNRGLKVRVSWMRGTHTMALCLAHLLSHITVFRGSDNPYFGIRILPPKQLWQLLEFGSVLPIILFKYVLPSELGWWVIGERSVIDFIAWIAYTTKDESYPKSLSSRFLLTLAAKSKARIYITASFDELVKRRSNEVNPRKLKKQLRIYERLWAMIEAYRLDTTDRDTSECLKELIRLVQ
jgi:energy-coupling factor transporter ATP-binding protein EcfA2